MYISKLPKEELVEKSDRIRRNLYWEKALYYPYEKAICQALLVPVPEVEVEEYTLEELQAIPSERGVGKLGSSGK